MTGAASYEIVLHLLYPQKPSHDTSLARPLNLQTSDLPPKVPSCVSFIQDAPSLSRNRYSDGFETVLGPSGVRGVGCPSRPPTLSPPVQCCVQEWRQKG